MPKSFRRSERTPPIVKTVSSPSGQAKFSILQFLDEYEFILAPLIFTAFALFTRLWRIGLSPIVTWDEAQ